MIFYSENNFEVRKFWMIVWLADSTKALTEPGSKVSDAADQINCEVDTS